MLRVGVTGVGAISALGLNATEFWCSLENGTCGIRPLTSIDSRQFRFRNAAEVHGYAPEEVFESSELVLMDRFAQFAVLSAREAIAHANVEWTPPLREKATVVTGSCMGGGRSQEEGYREVFQKGRSRVHPLTIPLAMSNAGASHISMFNGILGPTFTVSTACASSAHAIGQAFWMVRSGLTPLAIAGGSEAPLFFGGLRAWEAMRVISKDTCRPFSADRSGMILGEGGAMLVLEPIEAALARGVEPLVEIVGFGMTSDAHHITEPFYQGAARAMHSALTDAGLAPERIGYINAHGTATEANDRTETAAIRAVFGAHADRVAVSSTKSMHGHTLGAAGALEAVATVLALRNGVLPPTANFSAPDPACNLDVVPNHARKVVVEAGLSNSFAFGGLNAALCFKRVE